MRKPSNMVRVWRFRVRLHYTWYIALVLITIMVFTIFPESYPFWQRILLGVAAAMLFLLSVVVHELVHIFFASRRGISPKNITLYVFGGVSQTMDAKHPSVDLLIAVAGLLSTLVIVAIFYIVYVTLVLSGDIIAAAVIQWVAFINIALAVFHFIPAFPLDGGQILRAIIWMVNGDRNRATLITSWIGWGTAWLVAIGGIVMMIITNQWFLGGAMLVAGWGLQRAAVRSLYQVRVQTALHGVTVEKIMTREFPQTSREIDIDRLLRESLLLVGKQQLVVADRGEFQGVVTIDAIRAIPRRRWNNTKVGETMIPSDRLLTANPQQSAVALLEQMNELQIGQVPVVIDNKVVGVVIRDDINRLVEARSRLKI